MREMLQNLISMSFCAVLYLFRHAPRLRYRLPQVLHRGGARPAAFGGGDCCMVRIWRGERRALAGTRHFLGLAVMQVQSLCGNQAMAQTCGVWEILTRGSHKNDNDGADLWGPGYSWGSQQLGLAY